MHRSLFSPRARVLLGATVSLVLAACAGTAWATTGPSPAPAPAPHRIASLAPWGAAGALTPAQALSAAQACARHAGAAGFANNRRHGGNLVTAAAVCMAESGGRAHVYRCEATGAVGTYPPVNCR